MNSKYIRVPFANNGDKEPIPEAVQTNGSISWPEGWGADYELDIETEPDAKPIDRLDMNQLFNVITAAVKYLQENAAPEWITPEANGGTAYAYPFAATVTFVDGSGNRGVWSSLVSNNTAKPGTDSSKWGPYLYRPASDAEVSKGASFYPTLPQQVLKLIKDNRQVIDDATVDQKGIVQLSNLLFGDSEALAATERAVGQKFTQRLTPLGQTNLDTLTTRETQGIYMQTTDSYCTEANGYPPNCAAGLLLVYGSVYSANVQVYFSPLTGAIYSRRYQKSGGPYEDWKNASQPVQDATTQQKGIVQLSDKPNGTSASLAATEKAVGQKVTNAGFLGTTDLNTINTDAKRGIYTQNSNANATAARHYPEQIAGTLHALGIISGVLFQTYITISGNVYTRWGDGKGGYQGWVKVNRAVPAGVVNFVAVAGNGTAPLGYLVCNGAAVSRTTYASLFAKIGTRYGEGDKKTTFNLPRIAVNMALVSNLGNTAVGLSTIGQNLSHTHVATTAKAGSHKHPASTDKSGVHSHTGSTAESGEHTHNINRAQNNDVGRPYNRVTTANLANGVAAAAAAPAGIHTHTLSINESGSHDHKIAMETAGEHTHTITVETQGTSLNVAAGFYMLPCISY